MQGQLTQDHAAFGRSRSFLWRNAGSLPVPHARCTPGCSRRCEAREGPRSNAAPCKGKVIRYRVYGALVNHSSL